MKKLLIATSVAAILLTGCGGGGSSSDDTTTSDVTQITTESAPAAPTIENGEKVAEYVIADNPSTSQVLNSVEGNKPNLTAITNILLDTIKDHKTDTLNQTIDQVMDCSDGGTIAVHGDMNNDGSSTLVTTYSKCNLYGTYINGTITVSTANCNTGCGCTDVSVKYETPLTIQLATDAPVTIAEDSYINEKLFYDGSCTLTHMSALSSAITTYNNQTFKSLDFQTEMDFDLANNIISWYYTKGTLFIDNNQYVKVDPNYDMSQTPFVMQNYSNLISGEARFLMDYGSAKVVADDGSVFVYVDTDGDGTYDESTKVQ